MRNAFMDLFLPVQIETNTPTQDQETRASPLLLNNHSSYLRKTLTIVTNMVDNRSSWNRFPAEIRNMILQLIHTHGTNLGSCAAVSSEWQTYIEPQNFERIKVTLSNFSDSIK